MLPNASPEGRFEVHLQIKAGSADEMASQQGMAHMCEHVSYMGSRKRERLFGTSSQTNAQTDFHHTVYWAACPTMKPNTDVPMLPLALDAVLDVMEARFESSRVEKERSAILSEAAMVNTIDYRVEVQLLAALHAENRLHKRFPIGLIEQIQRWTPTELQAYHDAHYRPNNAHLYVIGEVDPEEARALIKSLFSHLPARPPPSYPPEEGVDEQNLALVNSHFPPINHEWAGSRVFGRDKPRVHIFRHELMQCFSMHLFAKFPVEPITTLAQYRAAITKRLVMVALQVRLNVHARGDPISMVEFSYLDSPREACAVCALDLMAEASGWEQAAATAVREIKRLAKFGLSQAELSRCLSALLSDCAQLAAQGDRMSNQDMLTLMMESVACGHTFMDPEQLQCATELVAETLTLEEVNSEAASLCAHIANFGTEGAAMPSTVVACAPADVELTEDMVLGAFTAAASQPVENSADVIVPASLVPPDAQAAMRERVPPSWTEEIPEGPTGVVMKTLQNGIKVNYRPCEAESQRAHLRVTVPSGRMTELKPGALALGARTMQEGGAMLDWTREQVELFCVDHLITAEIACNEEFLLMEFVFPTSKVGSGTDDVTGMEGVFQILHSLLHNLKWEDDALQRAKGAFRQTHEQVGKSLEAAAAEHLLASMSGHDARFLSVPPEHIEALTLEDVKTAVTRFLKTHNIEISLSGDFSPAEVDALSLQYLGTIPESRLDEPLPPIAAPSAGPVPTRDLNLRVPDSDARAVAYVAGAAPNKWGIMADGKPAIATGPDAFADGDKEAAKGPSGLMAKWRQAFSSSPAVPGFRSEGHRVYQSHPLFPVVTLQLLQEVLNRRLFSTVRERKRLTYDANMHLTSFERMAGGWYLVTVTAKPELAQQALDACKETLEAARTWDPISRDNLQSAAFELCSKHAGAMQTNRYWVDLMSGLQLGVMPDKDERYIADFIPIVQAIQVHDLQAMLACLATEEGQERWTCIGISGGDQPVDEAGHSAPSLSRR